MIRRILLPSLALVLALATTAAACGGGDDSAGSPSGEDASDESSTDGAADESSTDEAEGETDGGSSPDGSDGEDDMSGQLGVDREFTGEGSEAFCAEVESLRETGQDAAGVDDAAFADAMMAVTPPDEIAAEWTNLFTVQKAVAADPSGGALAEMSQEALDAWASDGNVVAAYLGDVCGMAEAGG
ncbi:MAG: hypothetical protein PV358_18105 [Acidimicrobiales bacterium]|nr:hypothetical protein [Acidimicrobiales bacterium]